MLKIPKRHDHRVLLSVIAGVLVVANGALISINERIKDQPHPGVVASAQTSRDQEAAQKQADQNAAKQQANKQMQQDSSDQTNAAKQTTQPTDTPDSTYAPPVRSSSSSGQVAPVLPQVGGMGGGVTPTTPTSNPQPAPPSLNLPTLPQVDLDPLCLCKTLNEVQQTVPSILPLN